MAPPTTRPATRRPGPARSPRRATTAAPHRASVPPPTPTPRTPHAKSLRQARRRVTPPMRRPHADSANVALADAGPPGTASHPASAAKPHAPTAKADCDPVGGGPAPKHPRPQQSRETGTESQDDVAGARRAPAPPAQHRSGQHRRPADEGCRKGRRREARGSSAERTAAATAAHGSNVGCTRAVGGHPGEDQKISIAYTRLSQRSRRVEWPGERMAQTHRSAGESEPVSVADRVEQSPGNRSRSGRCRRHREIDVPVGGADRDADPVGDGHRGCRR